MCVCVCVCVWGGGGGGADGCMPLTVLVDVYQCCCLLMFVWAYRFPKYFFVVKLGE